jgi:LuxR family maltose regulon positive regulatory protein
LLLSIGFEQCGASDKAFAALEHALHIGKAIGLVNSFVDEGPSARALLQRFRQFLGEGSTAETTYIDRLLAAFDDARIFSIAAPLAAEAVTVSSSDLLSARELEVLNHVARGLSNKEIGRSLELTPETVKWHLKNIFEKLNVSSRIEAVQSVLGIGTQGGGIVA